MTPRRALLLAHRWVGLALGLVLALLGATGSILSWQREIDAALHPALFRPSGPPDPALSYAAIQRLAEAGGHQVGSIRPPDAVWPVWVVAPPRGARGALTATLDPATGALLGERDARAGFIAVTRELHDTLLLRDFGGRQAVGWLGVLTLGFCLSGIWLWWPARRRPRPGAGDAAPAAGAAAQPRPAPPCRHLDRGHAGRGRRFGRRHRLPRLVPPPARHRPATATRRPAPRGRPGHRARCGGARRRCDRRGGTAAPAGPGGHRPDAARPPAPALDRHPAAGGLGCRAPRPQQSRRSIPPPAR
ncbi:PepSY domain-containing protein [Dankookia sp. P2]|uniref:PepSY domain-containing protein n=1 Tax=Dankookia sp. P2 TaxID=3423955 RepID=UPI003D67904D